MDLTLALDKINKTFYAGDNISGKILLINKLKQTVQYDLQIQVEGRLTVKNFKNNPPTNQNIPFYIKKIQIRSQEYSTVGSSTNISFKFPLNSENADLQNLYESYHGVRMSVSYELTAIALCNGKLYTSKPEKLIILVSGQGINKTFGTKRMPYQFTISNQNIESVKLAQDQVPQFQIECYVENINNCIDKPFNGFCCVKNCSVEIKSIELQFIRNEKILVKGLEDQGGSSEIQNLQIGDGDVLRNSEIPMYMLFPRIFSCANLDNNNVKLSFEMNIIIVLVNGVVIMDNFPVNLWRS